MATKKTKKAKELSEQTLADIEQLKKVKDEIKTLELLKDELDSKIREALGKAEIGTHNGIEVVSVANRETKSIPIALIEKKYPTFYSENLKITPWSFLQFKTSATATATADNRTSE